MNAPGTGKTYNTKQMVYNLVSETSLRNRYYTGYLDYKNNVEFCTFHQSYGYEEFIEALSLMVKAILSQKMGY